MNIVNIVLFVFALFHGVSVVVGIPVDSKPAPVNQPVNHAQHLANSHIYLAKVKQDYDAIVKEHQDAVQATQTAAGLLDTAKHDMDVANRNKPHVLARKLPHSFRNESTRMALQDISDTETAYYRAQHELAKAKRHEESRRRQIDLHRERVDETQKRHDNLALAANAAAGGSSQNNDAIGG